MPYSPGGIVDFAGRVLAQKLGEVCGRQSSRRTGPGAGGIVGVNYVAHAAPDGYNIVIMDPAIVINQTLQKSMPYDIFKDLVTISIVAHSPEVLIVAPQLGVKTYAELVAYGKANPGKLNYASAGVGTTPHLAAEMWKPRTGIEATHVPYKGVGPSFIDLMSGKVQMSFSSIAGAMPFTSKGSVIALATTGSTRSPVYPDLPTVAEVAAGLRGRSLARRLRQRRGRRPTCSPRSTAASTRRCRTTNCKAAFAKFGIDAARHAACGRRRVHQTEYEKWRKVIVDGHITLD